MPGMPGLSSTNLGASFDAAARAAAPGLPGLDAPSARQARPSRPFGAPALGKPTLGAAAQSAATPCGGSDCAGYAHTVSGLRLRAGRPDPAFGGLRLTPQVPQGVAALRSAAGLRPPSHYRPLGRPASLSLRHVSWLPPPVVGPLGRALLRGPRLNGLPHSGLRPMAPFAEQPW